MRLSSLYSNKTAIFNPIIFNPGFNVIIAEIHSPQKVDRDTHNLGKSTLVQLLNFLLLGGQPEFLTDSPKVSEAARNIFSEFVFFLEIQLPNDSFITIRRGTSEASKISFQLHAKGNSNLSQLSLDEWSHQKLLLERAKDYLDGVLDLEALKPWGFRKGMGYLLRTQTDFQGIFKLTKHAAVHSDWKPFLAHIFGLNSNLVGDHYKKIADIETKEHDTIVIRNELAGEIENLGKCESILLLKKNDAEKKQAFLDSFDFRAQDKVITKEIVDDLNAEIARLNEERYLLTQTRRKIKTSLEKDKILFSPDEAQSIFKEAGVLFAGQIKKDFEQLISFNKSITEERAKYLEEELSEVESRLKEMNSSINSMSKKCSEAMAYLNESDVFEKYKKYSKEMVGLQAEIALLERQCKNLKRLQEIGQEIRTLKEQSARLQTAIEENLNKESNNKESLYSKIRLYFNEIIETVIGRGAVITLSLNSKGNLEFEAEILDEAGSATCAGSGHTYKKFLCIAFDLAILRAWLPKPFPRFVYHDGAFETLDDRKKENLLVVLRQYSDLGIQSVITLIDSDLPKRSKDEGEVFVSNEIILKLHDKGESGRLFKMISW